MPLPKYQTAIEIINEVIVPQIDTNAQDIKAIAKEVVSNAKDFDKKVEEVYNALEAKEVETGGLFDTHKAGYTKYCDDLKAEIEKLTTQITSDTSTQDIGEIVDVLSSKIEALENEENFEYDDQELKDSITKLNVDFSVFKEKVLTSKSVIDEINSKEGVIEASSIKGLIQTLNDIANKGGNSNVKVGASILEILSNGTSVMQGATRLNFIGSTVTYNKGTIDITSSGGGSSSIGGTVTEGTAGSVLFINPAGILAQDNSNLFWDDSKNALGILTTTPGLNDTSSGIGGSTHLDIVGGDLRVGGGRLNLSNIGNAAEYLYSPSSSGQVYLGSRNNVVFLADNDGNGVGDFSWKTGSNVQDSTTNAKMYLTNAGRLGIGTTAPTHTLTLPSTSTGIALYNTADQTTNYERGRLFWSSNVLTLSTELGGTGTARAIQLIAVGSGSNSTLTLTRASLPTLAYTWGSTATTSGSYVTFSGTNTASSGTINAFAITPTINQATSAGYTALLVNPTETTTGSGSKLLADFQVGGTTKAAISNTGYLGIGAVATYPIDIQLALAQQQIKSTTGTNYVITRYNNTGGDFYVGRESSTGGAVLAGTTAYSAVLASGGAYSMHFGTNNTIGLTISSAQVVTIPNNSIITANAITATANAATIPVTKGRNIVTNNSAATLTITLTTSGAVNMQTVIVQILDFSAAAQTLTFVNTENSTVSVPATTNGSTTLPLTVGFIYNASTSKWRCIASA